MPLRFRPRIGPFVYTPPPPRTAPVTRGEDLAAVVLVLLGAASAGVMIMLCTIGSELWAGAETVFQVVTR